MILTIDIGNTTTTFGVFGKGTLNTHFSMATQPWRTPEEITSQLKTLTKTQRFNVAAVEQIVVCSVVPRMSSGLIKALGSLCDAPLHVIGETLQVPLKNRYTHPEQVGQDRLVGAYAAWKTYQRDCIIADFGTAITIDVVTKAGEYLGGIIAPGLQISLEALAMRTALLPKVEMQEPPELLGRDTVNSIRSGVLYGCAALCDGLVAQLKRRYAPKAVVLATGGASALVIKHTTTIDHHRPFLVLEGLAHLASHEVNPKKTKHDHK